jgi:glycosyltransferase involved in cell wall biosynthesis
VPSPERGLLTLSMIVKDEARTIARTIASVRPFLDRWVIVDTGSTDETRDVVRRELAGVPGELHEAPFVTFDVTRNLALDLCGDATEFILWLDADDELEGGEALRAFLLAERDREGPDREAYFVRVDTGVVFSSARLLRSRAGWRFKGAVHEVLVSPGKPPPAHRAPGVTIRHYPDAAALHRSHLRRERDIALLRQALEHNPGDARSAFYLALTYHWLGWHDEAARAFRRRVEMGGWREEIYQSKFGLAETCAARGDAWSEVLALYLDAHAFAPHRAEPLHRIAVHYDATREHALCFLFARRGIELPLPEQDVHFIETDVYTWKLHDLVASAAYWVGEHALGEASARKALESRPDDPRLQGNLAFYVDRRAKEP